MNSTPDGQAHASQRPDSRDTSRSWQATAGQSAEAVAPASAAGIAAALNSPGGTPGPEGPGGITATGRQGPKTRLPVMRGLKWLGTAALVYLALAYFTLPSLWELIEPRHPAIAGLPRHAETHAHIPGDPLNLGIVGTQDELLQALVAAGWFPADEVTLRSSLRIIEDTLLRHPYPHAPISPLYCFGRVQDLAFEKPVGHSPRQRHHVRFWKSDVVSDDGRPFWAGAAIFDVGVEISETTGQVTHRTDGHVDVERDLLASDLAAADRLTSRRYQPDFHSQRTGRNGGGDPWFTDGRLCVLVLNHPASSRSPTDSVEDSSGRPGGKTQDREPAVKPVEP